MIKMIKKFTCVALLLSFCVALNAESKQKIKSPVAYISIEDNGTDDSFKLEKVNKRAIIMQDKDNRSVVVVPADRKLTLKFAKTSNSYTKEKTEGSFEIEKADNKFSFKSESPEKYVSVSISKTQKDFYCPALSENRTYQLVIEENEFYIEDSIGNLIKEGTF